MDANTGKWMQSLTRFGGGESTLPPSLISADQGSIVAGWEVNREILEVPLGAEDYSTAVVGATVPVMSHVRFNKTGQAINNGAATTQTGWTIAKAGGAVWIDTAVVNDLGVATAVRGNWRPLMHRYGSGEEEWFKAFSGRLYFGSGVDFAYRWDGTFYCVGTAEVTAADRRTMVGTGTNWKTRPDGGANLAVRQGDMVFLRAGGATTNAWTIQFGLRIKSVTDNTHIVLSDDAPVTAGLGAGGSNTVEYMIVRAHRIYITRYAAAPVCAAQAGAGLDDGSYHYKFTFYNSQTGAESNASPASSAVVCGAGNNQVKVGRAGGPPESWPAFPGDESVHQADTIRIYRQKKTGTGTYYRVGSVVRDAAGDFPQYVDTVPDASIDVTLTEPLFHDVTPVLAHCIEYGGRLWTWNDWAGTDGYLCHSTVWSPEYWPTFVLGIDNDVTPGPGDDPTLGGRILVSGPGDPIVAVTIEGGSYGSSGVTGGNLLVRTRSRVFRIHGKSWLDFQVEEVLREPCVSVASAVNAGGLNLWLTDRGYVALPSGGSETIPLYGAAQSWFLQEHTQAPATTFYRPACAAYWRGNYVLHFPYLDTSVTPNVVQWITILHDVHSGQIRYTRLLEDAIRAHDFQVWSGPGDSGQLSYSGEDGKIHFLYTSTTATVAVDYRSRSLVPMNAEFYVNRRLEKLVLVWHSPAQQTVQVGVHSNDGIDYSYALTNQTIPATVSGKYSFTEIDFEVYPEGVSHALRIKGNLLPRTQLLAIIVNGSNLGAAWGRPLGG